MAQRKKSEAYRDAPRKSKTQDDQFLAPHSLEAEEALLGAVLINPDVLNDITLFLKADDFYILRHSWIYDAMLRLFYRGDIIDNLTVNDELKRNGRSAEVGGGAYITYLINNTPTSYHAEVYGRIIERAAVRRRLLEAAGNIAQLANDGNKDIGEVIDAAELYLATATEQRSTQRIVLQDQAMEATLADIDRRMELARETSVTGVPSGYEFMDNLFGGFQAQELYVVGGRSKAGKSSFLINIANGSAKLGTRIGFFSLEMNVNQIERRMLAMETGINSQQMRLGRITESQRRAIGEAAKAIGDYPICWDVTPQIAALELRSKVRMMVRRFDIQLVIIDYLQLLKPPGDALLHGNRERELSAMAGMLKELAREMNIPVIVAAQLNREALKNKKDEMRPRIEHLRGSDAIQHNADVVMLWHCRELVDPNADKTGDAIAFVDKNRDGPEIELYFKYDLGIQRITEAQKVNLNDLVPF